MGKTYTPSQAAATKKYLRSLKSLSIRLKEDDLNRYNSEASKRGMSLRQFVLFSLDEQIARGTEIPNTETVQAMRELDSGGVSFSGSTETLFNMLDED